MKDYRPAYVFLFFSIFLVIILGVSTFLTVLYGVPYGWDWNVYHVVAINQYLSGNYTPITQYPPMFHFLMIPAVLLLKDNVQVMQIVFSGLVYGITFYFIYRMEGLKTFVISGFILLSSITFFQWSFSMVSQIIFMMLFPIITLLYFKDKYAPAAILLLILFYAHFFAIFFFAALFLYSLIFKKKFLKYLLAVALLSLPSFITYTMPRVDFIINYRMFVPSQGTEVGGLGFLYPPNQLLLYSGVFIWLMLPLTIYGMYKQKRFDRKQLFYAICLLAFTPLFFASFFRWITFFSLFFSIFEGTVISKLIGGD